MPYAVNGEAVFELVDWLIDGGRPMADGRKIVSRFCEDLNSAGVPVDLFRLFIFTIHPIIKGRRLQWSQSGGATILEADFAFFETPEFQANPPPRVIATRQPMRRRLTVEAGAEFPALGELREEGFTDYLIQPVLYIDGDVHTMSWTTRHPDGFSDAAIDALERVRAPITRLVESYILRLNAENIISTYVGREAGSKVLRGKIKRGDAEEIEAVILFADLKDFTRYASERPVDAVLARLNRFFDAFEAPIVRNGGEILKFIGDGLLAIFPLRESDALRGQTAKAAFSAVSEARAALAGEPFGFRSALHIGRLSYGNMGASRRLDFTVIGNSVNLAARLLGVAAEFGADDVVSADFAAAIGRACRLVGTAHLKGVSGETPVYVVADSG